jgi:glycosyltransferase involved in cell wall biosynthesis
MKRIVFVTHVNAKGVPPQAMLVQRMLRREGFETVLVGRGETGAARLLDVAWRGLYWMLRADVAVVDVFGHRAFLYEALAIVYAKLLGRRVVAMLRGGGLPDFVRAWPRVSRWVLRRPERLLSPHGFLAEKLKELDLKISEVIPNIIEQDLYGYRERIPVRPRFLYLRGTHAIYNPETCLRAFALVQVRHPEASLTMAASGSLTACRELARELNLRNVSLIGVVPKAQIPALADRHDIYFQSNRVENMPVTILEMWASGLPVVATTAGGTPYLVRPEEDGLLVAPDDHRSLADACCRILDDPTLALRLVRNGRARVAEFTWPQVRTRWRQILALEPSAGTASCLTENGVTVS